MEKKKFNSNLCVQILFWIMASFFGGYFIIGEVKFPSEIGKDVESCRVYEEKWEMITGDDEKQPFDMKQPFAIKEGGTVRFETKLPKDVLNQSLMFWTMSQDVRVYIDGELREEYVTKDKRILGKESPSIYLFVELIPEDAGKTMQLELFSHTTGKAAFRDIYIGKKTALWMKIIKENLIAISVALLMLVIGFWCLVVSKILERVYHRVVPMKNLSWCVILCSIWVIANSSAKQFLFPNVLVASNIAFMAVGIIPMPFLLYMDGIQERRYHKCYVFQEVVVFIDFIMCFALSAGGFYDISAAFTGMALTCGISILLLIGTIFIDILTGRAKEYYLPLIGIFGVCVAGVLQLLAFSYKTASSFNGAFLAFGLVLLQVIAIVNTIKDVFQLVREKNEAVYASKLKAQFLANMSHEIRTPINAVLGMNEMILRESREQDILNYAEDIRSAGKSLLSLINDILDFSKIESGKMEIVPVEYMVSSLLNDTYNMLNGKAKDKNLNLTIHYDEEMPNSMYGDEIRIRQIIVNLLTNAIKYTEVGEVSLTLECHPIDEEHMMLQIIVKDTGIGISREDQEKLFDSFQRVDQKKNRNVEGTGLGLAITKQLIDLMDGTITLKSVYGAGSTFYVEIPQLIVSHKAIGHMNFLQNSSGNDGRGAVHHMGFEAPEARVLLVDDVTMNLKVMEGLLKETKMQVDSVDSGYACLDKMTQKCYDIIFLDHMMPEMDGIETLQRMKKLSRNLNQDTPVIILTANAIIGAREEYMQAGFTGYLSKPIDSVELEKIVQQYIAEEKIHPKKATSDNSTVVESEAMKIIDKKVASIKNEAEKSKEQREVPKDFLSQIDFLNKEVIKMLGDGNTDLYYQMIQMFVKGDKQTEIEDFYENRDWKNYCILVHALKGTARSIGADELSELASKQEQAAKEENEQNILAGHGEMMAAYAELLRKLQEIQ